MKSSESTSSTATYRTVRFRNIHGRRAGRGFRPVLIVFKILFVSIFVGGLVAVLAGFVFAPLPDDLQAWHIQAARLSRLYKHAIVPGLNAALVCGTLLAVSIWRVMIRMRWFQAKMLIVATAMPVLHFYMRGRSIALRDVLTQSSPDLVRATAIHEQLAAGTMAALAVAVAVLVLGRVKPRLWQDYARTFSKPAA